MAGTCRDSHFYYYGIKFALSAYATLFSVRCFPFFPPVFSRFSPRFPIFFPPRFPGVSPPFFPVFPHPRRGGLAFPAVSLLKVPISPSRSPKSLRKTRGASKPPGPAPNREFLGWLAPNWAILGSELGNFGVQTGRFWGEPAGFGGVPSASSPSAAPAAPLWQRVPFGA